MTININKSTMAALTGIILLVILLFNPVIFGGKTFGSADSLGPRAVGIALNHSQAVTGEIPLWQPWVFSGMPTAEAFTNLSKFYFPEYLFKLFFLSGMLIQLAHLILAGWGMFFLLKQLKCSLLASFLGAGGFMLTPYMVTMVVFGHGSQMMTAAFIPWVMWLTIRLWEKPGLMDAGWLALLLGFQLQRAHAQIAYYTWMLMGAYVLMLMILQLKNGSAGSLILKPFVLFTAAVIIGIGLSLLIYLPAMEYTPFSIRGGSPAGGADYNYATSWSFHPKEMLTFLIPSAFGFGGQTYWGHMPFTDYPNYMGIIFLVLALAGIIMKRDRMTWFLIITSGLALFIAFGRFFSPVYNFFFNYFPFFSKFRVPSMILILLQFNTALLAAMGLDGIFSLKKNKIPRWFWILTGLAVMFLLMLSFAGSGIESWLKSNFAAHYVQDNRMAAAIDDLRWKMWIKDAWILIGMISGLALSIWLFIEHRINRTAAGLLIISLALLDIGIVDHKIIQPGRKSGRNSQLISRKAADRYFEPDKVIQLLISDTSRFRIYPAGFLFGESRFAAFGLESLGGYHPAKLKLYQNFLENTGNAGSIPLLRMLNVKYVLSPQEINHPELISKAAGGLKTGRGEVPVFIYELFNNMSRAWFVKEVKKIDNLELTWKHISRPEFDPGNSAVVLDDIEFKIGTGTGKLDILEFDLQHILIKSESDKSEFLVLSEIYYPLRWKAFLDGAPVKIYQTNGVLRGVPVPPGNHFIEFQFDRSSFNKGVIISFSSFSLVMLIILGSFYRNRKK